jgi:hypothetical protein
VEDLRGAADLWAGFPVEANPRPMVFTSPTIDVSGFSNDEAKSAFGDGRITIASRVPDGAVRSLRAVGTATVRGPGTSIQLRTAVPATHSFRTDRGPRALRAWRLGFSDTRGPTYVVDEHELDTAWSPPGRPAKEFRWATGADATLGEGLSVVYRFFGSPRIYADYPRVRVLEERAVVVVAPVPIAIGGPDLRLLYAEKREVEFCLRRPLGHRVLVDPNGHPVTVTE